jgi:hypothetical protein
VHELNELVLKYERDKNQKRKICMTKTTKRNELVRPVVDVDVVEENVEQGEEAEEHVWVIPASDQQSYVVEEAEEALEVAKEEAVEVEEDEDAGKVPSQTEHAAGPTSEQFSYLSLPTEPAS